MERSFNELFSANVLSWNQYIYIAFNIFLCRIVITSFKILIITGISNEKSNKFTIYRILCRNVTIFYRQELAFNFSCSCFMAEDSHIKIVWLHVAVFSKHNILYFGDNVRLFKYYPLKVPQKFFSSFNYSNLYISFQIFLCTR